MRAKVFSPEQQAKIIEACKACTCLGERCYGIGVERVEGFNVFNQVDDKIDALGAYVLHYKVEVKLTGPTVFAMGQLMAVHFGIPYKSIAAFNKGFDGWEGKGECYEFGKSLRQYL